MRGGILVDKGDTLEARSSREDDCVVGRALRVRPQISAERIRQGATLGRFRSRTPWVDLLDRTNMVLFVDGLSDKRNAGAGIVIKGPSGFTVDHYLQFKFRASNNQTEYEALIVGLRLAKDLGARRLKCNTGSRLVVGQVQGEYQVKDDLLLQYYHKVVEAMKEFEEVTIHHIPQAENAIVDRLSKLVEGKEKGQLKTIIRKTLMRPSAGECAAVDRPADWISDVRELLRRSDARKDLKSIERRRALQFVTIGEDLYK